MNGMNFLIIGMSLLSVSAMADSFTDQGNYEILCHSASGRTQLNATIAGANLEQALELTVDGRSLTYVNSSMVELYSENKMDLDSGFPGHQTAAINGSIGNGHSITVVSGSSGATTSALHLLISQYATLVDNQNQNSGTFNGELSSTLDPRTPSATLPVIDLSCTWTMTF